MKHLNEIETDMINLRQRKTMQQAELKNKLNLAIAAKEQAAADMVKAQEETNVKTYTQAAGNMRSAQDMETMITAKLNDLNVEPLITLKEYTENKRDIIAAMGELTQDAAAKMVPIFAELKAIREELSHATTQANNLLKMNQRELARIPDEKGLTRVELENLPDKYNYPSQASLTDYVLNYYESIKGNWK